MRLFGSLNVRKPCSSKLGSFFWALVQSDFAHFCTHRIGAFLSEHLGALLVGLRLRMFTPCHLGDSACLSFFRPFSRIPRRLHASASFWRARRIIAIAAKRHVVSSRHESAVSGDQTALCCLGFLLAGDLADFFNRKRVFPVFANRSIKKGFAVASGVMALPSPRHRVLGIADVRLAIEAIGDLVKPPHHAGVIA